MHGSSAGFIDEEASPLDNFGVPSEMFGIYAIHREILKPSQVSVVRMNDQTNATKMLHYVPFELQESPELLLERMPK